MSIGKNIKSLRESNKMSQEEFGKIAGVSDKAVSTWENDVKIPRMGTIQKIADYFKIKKSDIIEDNSSILPKTKIVKNNYNDKELLNKYHSLDTFGKEAVDSILQVEYKRCTSIGDINNEEETPKIKIRSSVYNKASAGTGYMLDNEEWETIEIPDTYESRQADFALTISGNSMEPVYHDGDIVLVKSQPQIEIGDIGIFIINDEGYIKKYGGDRLISLNNKYKDIIFSEGDYIKCCGKVIGRV